MSLADDAKLERLQVDAAMVKAKDGLDALLAGVRAGKPAAALVNEYLELKQRVLFRVIGGLSRCRELEAAAEMVAASDRAEEAQRKLWEASERRFESTWASRLPHWGNAPDCKSAACGPDA